MAVNMSLDAKLLRGPAGSTAATEVRTCKDVSLKIKKGEAKISSRASRWALVKGAMKEAEFTVAFDSDANDANLQALIAVYGSNHHDTFPGYPGGDTSQAATAAAFVQQMTQYTDEGGNASATGSAVYQFGPYLITMPDNPVNSLSTVKIVGAGGALTADDTTGWLYQPSTGALLPNLTGTDSEGTAYSGY